MQYIELQIKLKDWFFILLIAILFSIILSIYTYLLVDIPILNAFSFGILLGFNIFIFSMGFISILNTHILPKLAKKYWLFLAIVFSFFSGFLGTILTYFIATFLDIYMISKFKENYFIFAIIIGVITYFVAALLYQFVKMSNKNEYSQKLLIDSRLKSLQRQLNPHFLFNSLNSLVELIHEDQDKAEENLMELSRFLRQSMKEKSLNSLKEELENLHIYVKLENVRFSNKILLRKTIADKFLDVKVPKFSIQLLVENAIKHGFDNTTKQLIIDIKVEKNDNLEIIVQNNGKKIDDAKFGIGLTNLQERLKILCKGKINLVRKDFPTYKITLGKCNENFDNG